MKGTSIAGISSIALAMAASGSAWAVTEINAAFVPEDPLEQHQIVATSCERPRGLATVKHPDDRIEIEVGDQGGRPADDRGRQ